MMLTVLVALLHFFTFLASAQQKPNILYIIADDHGWNDVDWHDPTLHTPNLNALAHSEHTVQLDRAYVNQLCSPTRSALFSGYYPYHLGTQHGVFQKLEPSGVPLKYSFFPERLLTLGYNTYIVGKWHLGYCKHDYLPTKRGFQKFRGYYGGAEDYYSHLTDGFEEGTKEEGLDFFHDTPHTFAADWSKEGYYSTQLFANESINFLRSHDSQRPFFLYLAFQAVHAPLQIPPLKYMEGKCSHIKRRHRRVYCGMVNALDDAIGSVVAELRALDLYKNTIIIFGSDNGGQTLAGGNNFPLRGNKNTLWEGGMRINSFVHSPANIKRHEVRTQLFNVVDWYATIMTMVGEKMDEYGDGINQWEMIVNNSMKHTRRRFVYNIYDKSAAIREGDYKLIVGKPGEPSGWIPPTRKVDYASWQDKSQKHWLFNVKHDPNERHDLSARKPKLLHRLMLQLRKWSTSAVPSIHKATDERGSPKYFNGTFASGWC
uniref:Sulfatase N-terminal domain-containing protein n=2 Tax=Plectus sambesii TaxID=2011161 RepID=A0A914X0G4_9BILA